MPKIGPSPHRPVPRGARARARHSAVLLLLSLCPRVMQALRRQWQGRGPGDITFTQLRILRFVGSSPGVPLRQLALHLMVSAPSASATAARLVRQGLLKADTPQSNRRRIALTLTPSGRAVLRRASRAARTELERHLLGLSERELATAIRALRKLLQALP